jgi:aminopeptidase N
VLVMANAYPMLAPLEYGSWRADPVQGAGDAVVSRTALYRVSVQAPDNWQIASSGSKVDDNLEAGVRTTQYATGPMREFMLVASPLLVLQEENVQDIRIQHWGLPETTPGWKDTLNVGVNSLDLYNTSFGPYPYREFDIISAPLRNAAGVEYPGLILIGDFLYTNTDTPSRLPTVVAHEVAHQWWYGLVGSDVLLHPWQDEALATFSAQLYEQKYDPAYYNGANDYYQDAVKQLEDKQGPQKIDGSVSSFAQSGAYGVVVYLKGELFFEAVREKIGDQKFFAGLQEYFQHSQYRTAAPDDLLGSFEGACSCSLDELYTEWGVQ